MATDHPVADVAIAAVIRETERTLDHSREVLESADRTLEASSRWRTETAAVQQEDEEEALPRMPR